MRAFSVRLAHIALLFVLGGWALSFAPTVATASDVCGSGQTDPLVHRVANATATVSADGSTLCGRTEAFVTVTEQLIAVNTGAGTTTAATAKAMANAASVLSPVTGSCPPNDLMEGESSGTWVDASGRSFHETEPAFAVAQEFCPGFPNVIPCTLNCGGAAPNPEPTPEP